jgi:dTDP-4-amino-4,6-dideoxygalactose transaminase
LIPRFKPDIGFRELIAAFSVPHKDDVERFEQAFAELMEQKYALGFPYGRTGLILLLEALGIKNKEIICPAYTCVVVPHAIVYSGNIPVFVDCEPVGFNMELEAACKAITKNTAAIIATSIFGYPVNLDKLGLVRRRHPQLQIIQDCAHSFAAKWHGRPVQSEGVAAVFGLNISKLVTSIFGGMITTDDKLLYSRIKQLRDVTLRPPGFKKRIMRLLYLLALFPSFSEILYGAINYLERHGLLNKFVKYYDENHIDMPGDYLEAITGVEARIGRVNLKRYPEIIKKRIDAAEYYFTKLKNRSVLKLPPKVAGATYSHFSVEVDNRTKWVQIGIKKGVQLGWLIEYCVPMMKTYGEHPEELFPNAARYSETLINLPIWGGKTVAKKVVKKLF